MKVCVVGAGAIGGYLAVKLARAGEDVTVVARGLHLSAIRTAGLTLTLADGTSEVAQPALATDDIALAGVHDLVLLTVKAPALRAVAPAIGPLCGPHTVIVPMQNGIPWWYFAKHGGPYEGRQIAAVDPEGVISAAIDVDRVIGSIVYPAAEIIAPGVIQHVEGDRFSLGELDGARTDRLQSIAKVFTRAGLRAPIRSDIRSEIWVKLWGNLSLNPISALTGATVAGICRHAPTRALATAAMAEAQTVGERLGVSFKISIEQRLNGAAAVGEHKTSMLQDVEAGKPTEIDALVGAVGELGRLTGVATPHLDTLYACVKLLEQRPRPAKH